MGSMAPEVIVDRCARVTVEIGSFRSNWIL